MISIVENVARVSGDVEMIGKPYNNEDLARRIREILDEEVVVG